MNKNALQLFTLVAALSLGSCSGNGTEAPNDQQNQQVPSQSDQSQDFSNNPLVPNDENPSITESGTGNSADEDNSDIDNNNQNPITSDPAVQNPVDTNLSNPDSVNQEPVTTDPAVQVPLVQVPVVSDPVVPDPLVQNTIRVNFDIEVPAYASNALQVRLTWSDKNLAAAWVGDEYWSISDDFPTNQRHPLTVTFYDGNGAITLGSYQATFITGANAVQTFQITASQFNVFLWDNDGDGTNNLFELRAGTDPWVFDSEELDVRNEIAVDERADILLRTSMFYESQITKIRPYSVQTEQLAPSIIDRNTPYTTTSVSVDVDTTGMGVFSDIYVYTDGFDITGITQEATRTTTGDSIVWMGTWDRYNTGAGVSEYIQFTVDTTLVNLSARRQEGVIRRESKGYFSEGGNINVDIVYNLSGTVVTGTSNCEATSGTITYSLQNTTTTTDAFETTVAKGTNDSFWTISVVTTEGELIDEYQVQAESPVFYCDFGT